MVAFRSVAAIDEDLFMRNRLLISCLVVLAGQTSAAWAAALASADPAGIEFFEKRVRPVLTQQCFKCHATNAEKIKGGLVLDSLAGALKGGDNGPAVVPGRPEKSLLITAVQYTNEDMKMPPKTRLPAAVVADLVRWVQMGAPWPVEKGIATATPASVGPTGNYDRLRKEHWAWQPVHDTPTPTFARHDWVRNDIDAFVLNRLEAKGIVPVSDADKTTLLRRLTFDLTGLPPTPAELAAFLSDGSPDAYAKKVDQLLASHAFGERWGRHWLDVARYAESTGSSRNIPYGYAWRYRDYVIDSFNKDKPFNRFITEQIAGDLLPSSSTAEKNEAIVATGFLAIGVKDLNERDREKFKMDVVDEQIDTTSRAILGLTVACARCHDHKFDPIPQADYYSMAGIFQSTEILAGVKPRSKAARNDYEAAEQLYHLENLPTSAFVPTAAENKAIQPSPGRLAALQARLAKAKQAFMDARSGGKSTAAARKAAKQEMQDIQAEIDSLSASSTPAAAIAGGAAIGVKDGTPGDCYVRLHGEPHDYGAMPPRGFVSLVQLSDVPHVSRSQSGRLELAQWMTSPQNPLTPRVMVNRIWAKMFGVGLVRTVDNFGTTGEAPSDQQLLDHLATQFVQQGWSVKKLIRQIAMSHAYQLSSRNDPADFKIDPADRLCWRMHGRRLDAEEIRDAILSVSGQLDRRPMIGSMAAAMPVAEIRNVRVADRAADGSHRSVYVPIFREALPAVLDLFDFAEPTMVMGNRDTTTVSTQALFMMNDEFVLEQSKAMASRLLAHGQTPKTDAERIELAYRLAFGRTPTAPETTRAASFIKDFQHEEAGKDKNPQEAAWAAFCQALLASAEFRYVN